MKFSILFVIKFNFYSSPFISILFSFSVGIYLGFELIFIEKNVLIYINFFLLLSLIYGIYLKHKSIVFFTFCLFFVSLGIVLVEERCHSGLSDCFEDEYKVGDSYFLSVVEVGNQQKKWTKIIGNIVSFKSSSTLFNCDEKVVLFIENNSKLFFVGDNISLNADLLPIENKNNPGEFDAKYFYKSKGINKIAFVQKDAFLKLGNSISFLSFWSLKARDYLGGILQKHLTGQELALAQALILGDRSFLDPETTKDFGNSGAMHVLAVSGLHIGIILQIILYVLKLFSKFISKQKSLVIALILIWAYTFVSGLSASVLRSTFMFSVLAISQLNGKSYNSINSLFFTCFVLLLINPYFLFDIGFQLSVLAMLGIFLFYKPISNWLFFKNKWILKIWEGTAIGLAAQFVTVPLTLYYFHQFPNYFILTNIGLMFSTGLILGLGLFVFSFSWLKYFGKLSIFLMSAVLFLTLFFVSFIDGLPGSVATGFVLTKSIVAFSFFIIFSIYLLRKSSENLLKVLFISAFSLVFLSVYKRNENLNLSEICFFNQSKSTFIIKDKMDAYCFYDGEKKDLDKCKFTVESYLKLYPATVQYFSLKGLDWELKKSNLAVTVNRHKEGVLIRINKRKYFLKNRKSTKFNDGKVICLPWVKTVLKSDLSLRYKAYRFFL